VRQSVGVSVLGLGENVGQVGEKVEDQSDPEISGGGGGGSVGVVRSLVNFLRYPRPSPRKGRQTGPGERITIQVRSASPIEDSSWS
jgi:hypothetical protein